MEESRQNEAPNTKPEAKGKGQKWRPVKPQHPKRDGRCGPYNNQKDRTAPDRLIVLTYDKNDKRGNCPEE